MNRLKELRKTKKLTLKQLGKNVNMLDSRLSQYENNIRTPKPETWQALADFYGVSVPYLQGAYSKEEILKILQESYKKRYEQKTTFPINTSDLYIFVGVNEYLIAKKVIPYNIPKTNELLNPEQVNDFNFWLDKFSDIFNTISIKWLLTKPELEASKEDVKSALIEALTIVRDKTIRYEDGTIKPDNALYKRREFLENHSN